jgi:nitric oxide reductase NorE protein
MAPTEVDVAPTTEEIARIPGGGDIWFFVVFESLVFTSYLCVYLYLRTQHERAFLQAQRALNVPLGVLATVVLLTSSWTIALCVGHARAGEDRLARRFALMTIALGGLFFAFKLAEWVRLTRDGHSITSSYYMQYFFFLTGMHAIHLLIGFLVLGVLIRQIGDPDRRSMATTETCATYWHTVDLFWVLIFAMLYVAR